MPDVALAGWAREAMNIDTAIETVGSGQQVTVAVLSTGVDTDHPDLQGRLKPLINLTGDTPAGNDPLGQGTFLAGLIAANRNGDTGIDGVCPWAKVLPVKVITDGGTGSVGTLAGGIRRATGEGADIILVGVGTYIDFPELKDAVRAAEANNIPVVAPVAGNNQGPPTYPAAYPQALAVSPAGKFSKQLAKIGLGRSAVGRGVDVVAPGMSAEGLKSSSADTTKAGGSGVAAGYLTGALAIYLGGHNYRGIDKLGRRIDRSVSLRFTPDYLLPSNNQPPARLPGFLNAAKLVGEDFPAGGKLAMIPSFELVPEKPVAGKEALLRVRVANLGDSPVKGELYWYTGTQDKLDRADTQAVIDVPKLQAGEATVVDTPWTPPDTEAFLTYPMMVSTWTGYRSDTEINGTNLLMNFTEVNPVEVENLAVVESGLEISLAGEERLQFNLQGVVENKSSKAVQNVEVQGRVGTHKLGTEVVGELKPGRREKLAWEKELAIEELEASRASVRVEKLAGERISSDNTGRIEWAKIVPDSYRQVFPAIYVSPTGQGRR